MDKKLLYNLLFSVFWAGSILATKLALNSGLDPIIFNFQTTLVVVLILTPYMILFHKKDLMKIHKREIKIILLLGLVLSFAYIISNQSLKLTTSINYGFLIKTTVIFTPLLSLLFLNEKITVKKIFFMTVFLIGAFLISTNGQLVIPHKGDLLVMLTALLFSTGLIISKLLSGKLSPEVSGAIRPISAFIFLVIITPLISKSFSIATVLDINTAKYVLLASIFGVLLTIFLGKSIVSSTASYFTLMNNMTSVFVLLGGLIFLSETITFVQGIGTIITIASAIFVQKSEI